MHRGHAGVEGGGNGSDHSYKPKSSPPSGNPCLLVGINGRFVGGIRSTSLLYQIICLQSVLFFGFIAGLGATKAFPVRKRCDYGWLAIASASGITGLLFLVTGITGKIWLLGI